MRWDRVRSALRRLGPALRAATAADRETWRGLIRGSNRNWFR